MRAIKILLGRGGTRRCRPADVSRRTTISTRPDNYGTARTDPGPSETSSETRRRKRERIETARKRSVPKKSRGQAINKGGHFPKNDHELWPRRMRSASHIASRVIRKRQNTKRWWGEARGGATQPVGTAREMARQKISEDPGLQFHAGGRPDKSMQPLRGHRSTPTHDTTILTSIYE